MKQLTELTKYVITPNVRFYGGFVYDGEDIFLCDDKDEDEDFKLHIKQRIVNNILITDGEKEYQTLKGKNVKENWHQEVEIEKGQKLIYLEGQGFTLSEYKMVTIDEAKDIYELLKGDKEDDSGRNEEKNS
jgi:hypothetical protein|nr:MAG TPA: hypothetical protein [Caudoviricetes sp.]DAV97327.1 MAG TPA: hypothetical protein [Caudoviricetes sp.]